MGLSQPFVVGAIEYIRYFATIWLKWATFKVERKSLGCLCINITCDSLTICDYMNFSFRGMVRRAEEKQSLYEAQSYVRAPLLNQQEQEKEGKMVVMVAKKRR